MVCCSASGCSNRSGRRRPTDTKKITFHRLPKKEDMRQKWVQAINRPNWKPSMSSVLCSNHFTEDCFDRSSGLNITRLREHAVPSIFNESPSKLRQKQKRGQQEVKMSSITNGNVPPSIANDIINRAKIRFENMIKCKEEVLSTSACSLQGVPNTDQNSLKNMQNASMNELLPADQKTLKNSQNTVPNETSPTEQKCLQSSSQNSSNDSLLTNHSSLKNSQVAPSNTFLLINLNCLQNLKNTTSNQSFTDHDYLGSTQSTPPSNQKSLQSSQNTSSKESLPSDTLFKNPQNISCNESLSTSQSSLENFQNTSSSKYLVDQKFVCQKCDSIRNHYKQRIVMYQSKVKILQQNCRRQGKRLTAAQNKIKDLKLKCKTLSGNEYLMNLLENTTGINRELLERQNKIHNHLAKEYSPELRHFALTLHHYSPEAYNYIRENLTNCLPHPKTLASWAKHINGNSENMDEESFEDMYDTVEESKEDIYDIVEESKGDIYDTFEESESEDITLLLVD